MDKSSLGDRMKGYENCYRSYLPERLPVIIRVDGKAFHTFTKTMQKPFDLNLHNVMTDTMNYVASNIQNCDFAYTQSDEISFLLINYKELNTESWYKNNIQKMVSIAAATTTAFFNTHYSQMPLFDARVFVLPKEEVTNYFLWRQQDCSRNSISMAARSCYSHKECQGKNTIILQDMLHQKGINWNDYPTWFKRGSCSYKVNKLINEVERSEWKIDEEIPIFSQDRDFIERYIGI